MRGAERAAISPLQGKRLLSEGAEIAQMVDVDSLARRSRMAVERLLSSRRCCGCLKDEDKHQCCSKHPSASPAEPARGKGGA